MCGPSRRMESALATTTAPVPCLRLGRWSSVIASFSSRRQTLAAGKPDVREDPGYSRELWFGLRFVFKGAFPFVNVADDDAQREAEVILFLLGLKRKRGPCLQIIGLEPQCEPLIDFAVNAAAGQQRPTSADFREPLPLGRCLAPRTLMSVHQLTNRRPAFPFAAGKLRTKKKVVLSSRGVEGG